MSHDDSRKSKHLIGTGEHAALQPVMRRSKPDHTLHDHLPKSDFGYQSAQGIPIRQGCHTSLHSVLKGVVTLGCVQILFPLPIPL